jgi:hypothetical protein
MHLLTADGSSCFPGIVDAIAKAGVAPGEGTEGAWDAVQHKVWNEGHPALCQDPPQPLHVREEGRAGGGGEQSQCMQPQVK